MSKLSYRIEIAAENALIVYFSEEMTPSVAALVAEARTILQRELADELIELIPSYGSLLLCFDPYRFHQYDIRRKVRSLLRLVADGVSVTQSAEGPSRLVRLPVYYGEQAGPDLKRIAQLHNLAIEQVIELHYQSIYQVYAIGFAPGFGYLGQVNHQIATPRLSTPRTHVPKGAVAIADQQTAIYPNASPGGWNIIGNCPIDMFDKTNSPTTRFLVGDEIQFYPISRKEFFELGGKLD